MAAKFAAVLLLCAGLALGQIHHQPNGHHNWDPHHGDPNLDLGTHGTLHTFDDQIRVLVDTQHNYLAIKSLHSYTCYLISLEQSHMTAQEIVDDINQNSDQILTTEFRPGQMLSHSDTQHAFGHRVAHFCLHNPTFLTQRYLVPDMPHHSTPLPQ